MEPSSTDSENTTSKPCPAPRSSSTFAGAGRTLEESGRTTSSVAVQEKNALPVVALVSSASKWA
jgi:hypothetical protein